MLSDNLVEFIEPIISCAGAYALALSTANKRLSHDRSRALKISARKGRDFALSNNTPSSFHAEPERDAAAVFRTVEP